MLYDPKWNDSADVGTGSIRDILIRARHLIEDRKDWCSNGMGDGVTTGRCAIHAINAAQGVRPSDFTTTQGFVENELLNCSHLGDFNDSHTHDEVLTLFDEAI